MTNNNKNRTPTNSYEEAIKGVFQLAKSPTGKIILIVVGSYGVLYLSKYVLNTTAGSVRAVKNLITAIKE